MEEQTRLTASRNGFKGHVTRLFHKIDDLISGEFDDYSATSLSNAVEQLTTKMEKITHIDEQLIKLYTEPSDLEAAVMDSEELQDNIMDKIARARRYIELQATATRRSRTVSPPPVVQLQSTDRDQSHSASNVAQASNTLPSNTPVDTSHEYTIATSQLSTATVQPPIMTTPDQLSAVATSQFSTASQLPTSEYNVEVPSTYRPFTTSTVFAPGTLYEPQRSTQSHRFPATGITTNVIPPIQQFANIRLSKLTLPTFAGDLLEWLTFWDSFYCTIHANPNLSGIQKFSYLKAQLQGDAARTIAGLPLTEANYNNSVALLEDRYGQRHKLVEAHMRALRDMSSPSNSLSSLRMFYDSVESHIRGLASLGKSETSYSELLVPIILDKLPTDVQRNLAREHSNTQWILPDLMAAILKEIRVLECGQYSTQKQISRPSTASFVVISRDHSTRKPHQDNRDNKRRNQCVFCKGSHSAHSCDVVTDYQKRLDIVKDNSLCYNCLARHRVSQCPSKYRCRKCKKKHHTSLCSNSESTSTSRGTTNEQKTDVTTSTSQLLTTNTPTSGLLTPTSHCKTPENTTTCLLKTAVAPIIAGGIRSQANILFDEGAQRSFMSLAMSKELQITPESTTDVAVASFGTTSLTQQKLGTATVEIETMSGEQIPLVVLIVPTISAPIQNSILRSVRSMPYLQGLKLAQPVTSEGNFTISLLIGTDYYWSFVQDHIVRGQGPTAQQSKLGYLLSGPLSSAISESTASALLQITSVMTID